MQHEYIEDKMDLMAPSVTALVGDQLAARLIAHASILTSLAKYPTSAVQGAEKVLCRTLETKSNTPKYRQIFKSTFIGRAAAKNKGRISKDLANKCSIASCIDCFFDNPSKIFGGTSKKQEGGRLSCYGMAMFSRRVLKG